QVGGGGATAVVRTSRLRGSSNPIRTGAPDASVRTELKYEWVLWFDISKAMSQGCARSERSQEGNRHGLRACSRLGWTYHSSTHGQPRSSSAYDSPTTMPMRDSGKDARSFWRNGVIRSKFPSRLSCRTTRMRRGGSEAAARRAKRRATSRSVALLRALLDCFA